jgi:cytochrome c-type biogenesis protein CcmH
MTAFVLVAALMTAGALGVLLWPLYRRRAEALRGTLVTIVVIALALPLAAALLYRALSNWSWDPQAADADSAQQHAIGAMVAKLEARLKSNPDDVDGWMMLGRSREVMNDVPGAVQAFGEAYRASGGRNAEVTVDYAEAMAMADPPALRGRAGELFENALALDPSNPKALFYGGMALVLDGKLEAARARWVTLVREPLPEDLRAAVAARIGELDQKLGRPPDAEIAALAQAPPAADAAGAGAAAPPAASGPGTVTVRVSIAPALAARVPAGAPLFVLARDPGQPGPPFAARRLAGAALPLEVRLTAADAMMPQRTLRDARQLVIVARYSASGAPQAASGDLYGEVPYDLAKGLPTDLVIDRVVP